MRHKIHIERVVGREERKLVKRLLYSYRNSSVRLKCCDLAKNIHTYTPPCCIHVLSTPNEPILQLAMDSQYFHQNKAMVIINDTNDQSKNL